VSPDLIPDLAHHALGGVSNRLDGEGREEVRQHGSEEETSEDFWLGEGDKGAERETSVVKEASVEGERDQDGRADGEALSDGGGGVSGGVEGISDLADLVSELSHFGDASGIVGDGAIPVDGEGDGQVGEHAEGGEGDAVEAEEEVGEVGSDGDEERGHYGREVAEGESESDVGAGAGDAALGEVAYGLVRVRGHVLCEGSDDEAGNQAEDRAEERMNLETAGNAMSGDTELETSRISEGGSEVDQADQDESRDDKLDLEGSLDLSVDVDFHAENGEGADQDADDDTEGDDHEGVEEVADVEVATGTDKGVAGEHESGAGRLSEGAEKIGAHAGDVSDVVADVVSDGGGVPGGVLGEARLHLSDEIGADIGGLGVNSSSDAAEKGHEGAAETVAGHAFEEHQVFTSVSTEIW
jgi:hypothetical protein